MQTVFISKKSLVEVGEVMDFPLLLSVGCIVKMGHVSYMVVDVIVDLDQNRIEVYLSS